MNSSSTTRNPISSRTSSSSNHLCRRLFHRRRVERLVADVTGDHGEHGEDDPDADERPGQRHAPTGRGHRAPPSMRHGLPWAKRSHRPSGMKRRTPGSGALLKGADRKGNREAYGGEHADELPSVLEGLRHHRVREHRQDGAACEGEDESDRVRRRVLEQARTRRGTRARRRRSRAPRGRGCAIALHPALERPVVAAMASGRFEKKTAASTAALTPSPARRPRPITIDSGMPSSTIPSTIARARATRLLATRPLAAFAAEPVDQRVTDREHRAPREQPESDAAASVTRLERLADELVGDRADENPGPERHDQAQRPVGNANTERDQATQDQGRARKRSPGERLSHGESFSCRGRR